MYLQAIKSVKQNAAMSVNRSILKKSRHIGFGVFIVHTSMVSTIRRMNIGGSLVDTLAVSKKCLKSI